MSNTPPRPTNWPFRDYIKDGQTHRAVVPPPPPPAPLEDALF